MALVAGCRPQFLLASFLIIPIFKSVIYKDYRVEIKGNISKYLCVIIPYAVVAAGLMYYNYIRFNSPFDFGANYNLTTNYMPLRGFNLARLVDGTLMYFLQPPDISFRFPFIHGTKFHTDYVGLTVIEPMYGGVLFICPFTLLLFMLPKLKISLKSKKLYLFVIMLVAMTVLVAFADTEMSALLLRYFGDFLYMLILGAVIIMFTLLERYGNKRGIISAAVALGMITVMLSFFLGVNETTFSPGVTEGLFRIYSMFI